MTNMVRVLNLRVNDDIETTEVRIVNNLAPRQDMDTNRVVIDWWFHHGVAVMEPINGTEIVLNENDFDSFVADELEELCGI